MRKITTQITSLFTALLFAGALSAQTVGDVAAESEGGMGDNSLGLTIEGYFLYGLNGGTGSSEYESGDLTTGSTATNTYVFSGVKSIGGGLNLGYAIAENLDAVVGFKFNSYSSGDFAANADSGATATGLLVDLVDEDAALNKFRAAVATTAAIYYATDLTANKNLLATLGAGAASSDYDTYGAAGAQKLALYTLCQKSAVSCDSTNSAAVEAVVGSYTSLTSTHANWANDTSTADRDNLAGASAAGFVGAVAAGSGFDTGEAKMVDYLISNGLDTGTYSGTANAEFTSMNINIGLRPKVKAFMGEFYGGAGINIALPQTITQTISLSGGDTLTTGITSASIESKYGMSIGMYGEVGYNYDVMPNLYVGIGLRTNFNTGLNTDLERTTSFNLSDGTVYKLVRTGKESSTEAGLSYTESGTTSSRNAKQGSFGLTDAQFQLNVGYRL